MFQRLTIRNFSKKYGNHEVFKNLNLNFKKDQIYTLTGPSGKGKTTFLNCLAGIETEFEGEILLDEHSLTPKLRSKFFYPHLGFMFQDLALWPHKTIMQNLILASNIRHLDSEITKASAKSFLEKFELSAFVNHYPEQISGGQKQRIAFIRSIIHSPQLLLLDEPSSSLDLANKQIMAQIIAHGLKKSSIIIVVSHDHEFLEMLEPELERFSF